MFAGLGERPWVYFVHSLHGVPDDPTTVAATCEYGSTVNAAFRQDNVFAAQFHPEKSATPASRCSATSCASPPVSRRDAAAVELYPAIDLRGGRVVRLAQGDYDAETVYGDDPVGRGRRRSPTAGATWIHVVDLDAARTGEPVNRPVVAAIARRRRRAGAGADRRGSAHASTTSRRSPRRASRGS